MINPNESIYDFNTRFLELYDQLYTTDQSAISVIDYENAVSMAEVSDLETACNFTEMYENILNETQGNQEMWSSYGNTSNYNRRNNFFKSGRLNYNNIFMNQYNNNNSNFTPFNNNFNTINNSGNFNRIKRFNNFSLNSSSRVNSTGLRNLSNNGKFENTNFTSNNGNNYNNNNNNGNFRNTDFNSNNGNNYKNNNNNNGNIKDNSINNNNPDIMVDLTNRMKNIKIKSCYFCHQTDHVLKDCVALARFENDPNHENCINSLYSQKN